MTHSALVQRFVRPSDQTTIELDDRGISVVNEDSKDRMLYEDVKSITYELRSQLVRVKSQKTEIPVYLDVEGEDGDFEDLFHTLIARTHVVPATEGRSSTFGRFNGTRIGYWCALTALILALIFWLVPQQTNWIIALAIAVLWLTTARYGGFALEKRLNVQNEGYVFERLWSRKLRSFSELVSIRIRVLRKHHPILGLEISERSGNIEQFFGLGEQTVDALITLRHATRVHSQNQSMGNVKEGN